VLIPNRAGNTTDLVVLAVTGMAGFQQVSNFSIIYEPQGMSCGNVEALKK
jgi:hypothetical protein